MEDRNILLEIAEKEGKRHRNSLSLIASESEPYPELLEFAKYPLSNKYSEGYPGRRFYGGCENIDLIENKAIEEAKRAFKCSYANVQCYSGSIANFAIYKALLTLGDKILSLEMSCGGHLTHSSEHSFVGDLYHVITYSLDKKTMRIDYDELERITMDERPSLIIAGSSSYPFSIDFGRFRQIADRVGAYLLADICHYSGLIIAGLHESCFPHAHVAMFTTHKQVRGTRGAVILWNEENLTGRLNKSVFPGIQGGMNPCSVAMNALALSKTKEEEYVKYMEKVLECARNLSEKLIELGAEVIGGGTETHMLLVNVKKSFGLNGRRASDLLEKAGIIVNANLIPFDEESPYISSGIRLGTLNLALLNPTREDCH